VTRDGTDPPEPMSGDSFPILGEPLTVELANTRYTHSGGVIDFLASDDLVASWFAHAPGAAGLSVPTRFSTRDAEAVRQVRDAAHGLLDSVVSERGAIDTRGVAVLNRHAAAAPCRSRLEWPPTGPIATAVYAGSQSEVLLAQLATDVITFMSGPELARVRRCAHPDCQMFFVQHHHKRRFCHESCAHRARQARYYLATRSTEREDAGR
jgi:predicted RNA-binding Zn ribbon-like protein